MYRSFKDEFDATDSFLCFDIDDQMRSVIQYYNIDTFFNGLMALAYLPKSEYVKYSYFFNKILKNEDIMECIFMTFSRTLADEEKEPKLMSNFYNFFKKLFIRTIELKESGEPPHVIMKHIRTTVKYYDNIFCEHVSEIAENRVKETPESYVRLFMYMLKYSLVIVVRWETNMCVFQSVLKQEDGLNRFLDLIYRVYNFLTFDADYRIVSITPEEYKKIKEENRGSYISTGLRYFDALFKDYPGYKKGWLCVVGGAYGMGKTKFLICMGANAIKQGFNVLHITAENDEDEVIEDYVSAYLGEEFNDAKEELLEEVSDKIRDRIRIVKVRPLDFTVDSIKTFIEMLKHKGFETDLLIVDSINLMTVKGVNGSNGASKYDKGEKIMEGLFDLAKSYNVAIWTCAQLQRQGVRRSQQGNGDEEVEAKSEDISLSYAIPAFAHVYVTLNQNAQELRNNAMRVYVDKIRRGISKVTVPVIFDKGRMILRDATMDEINMYFGEKTRNSFTLIVNRLNKLGIDVPDGNDDYDPPPNNTPPDKNRKINENIDETTDTNEVKINVEKENTESVNPIQNEKSIENNSCEDDKIIESILEKKGAEKIDDKTYMVNGEKINIDEIKKMVKEFMYDGVKSESKTKVVKVNLYPHKKYDIYLYCVFENKKIIEAGLIDVKNKGIKLYYIDKNSNYFFDEKNYIIFNRRLLRDEHNPESMESTNKISEWIDKQIQEEYGISFDDFREEYEFDKSKVYEILNGKSDNNEKQPAGLNIDESKGSNETLNNKENSNIEEQIENERKDVGGKDKNDVNNKEKSTMNVKENETNKTKSKNGQKKNGNNKKYDVFQDLHNIGLIGVVHHTYVKKNGTLSCNYGILKGFDKSTKGRLSLAFGRQLDEDVKLSLFEYSHNDGDKWRKIKIYLIPAQKKYLYVGRDIKKYKDEILDWAYDKAVVDGVKYIPSFWLKFDKELIKKFLNEFAGKIGEYLEHGNDKDVILVYDKTYRQHFSLKDFVKLVCETKLVKYKDVLYITNGEKILLRDLMIKYNIINEEENKIETVEETRDTNFNRNEINDNLVDEIKENDSEKVVEVDDNVDISMKTSSSVNVVDDYVPDINEPESEIQIDNSQDASNDYNNEVSSKDKNDTKEGKSSKYIKPHDELLSGFVGNEEKFMELVKEKIDDIIEFYTKDFSELKEKSKLIAIKSDNVENPFFLKRGKIQFEIECDNYKKAFMKYIDEIELDKEVKRTLRNKVQIIKLFMPNGEGEFRFSHEELMEYSDVQEYPFTKFIFFVRENEEEKDFFSHLYYCLNMGEIWRFEEYRIPEFRKKMENGEIDYCIFEPEKFKDKEIV